MEAPLDSKPLNRSASISTAPPGAEANLVMAVAKKDAKGSLDSLEGAMMLQKLGDLQAFFFFRGLVWVGDLLKSLLPLWLCFISGCFSDKGGSSKDLFCLENTKVKKHLTRRDLWTVLSS